MPYFDRNVAQTCIFPDCGRRVIAKGLCPAHYAQNAKNRALTPIKSRISKPNEIIYADGCAALILTDTHGKERGRAYLNVEDVASVASVHWSYRNGYAVHATKKGAVFMHNIILRAPPGKEVDHEDGNGLNNRRGNLRIVTHAQNTQNRAGTGTSGQRGVYWHKSAKRWIARVFFDGHSYHGGTFADFDEAVEVVIKLRASLFTHHNEKRHGNVE